MSQSSSFATFMRIFDHFTLAPIREIQIDTTNLSRSDRLFVYGGYGFLALFALCSFLVDIFGVSLGDLTYRAPGLPTRTVSLFVVLVSGAGFVVSWTCLLFTTTRMQRIGKIVIFGLFLVHSSFFVRFEPIPVVVRILMALCVAGVSFWLLKIASQRGLAALACIPIALLLTMFMIVWRVINDDNAWLSQLHNTFLLGLMASIPLWLISGISLATLSINGAAAIITRLRDSFSYRTLRNVLLIVLFGHPLLSWLLSGMIDIFFLLGNSFRVLGDILRVDGFFSLMFAMMAGGLLLLQRLSLRVAGILLFLRLAFSFFATTLFVALYGQFNLADPFSGAVEQLQIMPPTAFFTLTLIVSVLGFFVPFMNIETVHWKRLLRIPLAFGVVFLLMTCFFFLLHAREVQGATNIAEDVLFPLFFVGAVLVGTPVLFWIAFRRLHVFVGAADA
jgi:hypothetical protein